METIRPLLSGDDDRLAFQLCGFGPIAAAARAGALIARYKPERVLLVGIAGSFDTETISAWDGVPIRRKSPVSESGSDQESIIKALTSWVGNSSVAAMHSLRSVTS